MDMDLPKYDRLGMVGIAFMLGVGIRSLYNWSEAYQNGGIDALRNNMEGAADLQRPTRLR